MEYLENVIRNNIAGSIVIEMLRVEYTVKTYVLLKI